MKIIMQIDIKQVLNTFYLFIYFFIAAATSTGDFDNEKN